MATAQDTFTRAIAISDANQGALNMTPGETLARLNYARTRLFGRLAQENRYYYLTAGSAGSSNAALNRTLDLSAVTPPIERILADGILLPGGTPLNIVDFQDQAAALAPRAFPAGLVLHEIGSEWGAAGIIAFTIWYIYRPVDFVITGALTQDMGLPERFNGYFDYDLAIYMFNRDLGRVQADPNGLNVLAAQQEAAYADIVQYLDHVIGPVQRRFALPTSPKGDKA